MMCKSDIQKPGVSGIMRVHNERDFIEPCIRSCIDALDELVIVYNDCTDGSEEVIERFRDEYPQKIKVYAYPYKILGVGLTDEEYAYAKTLPLDSPHLLCNYYNFALSKVTYQYAVKIDADQMYFTEVLQDYCNFCRQPSVYLKPLSVCIGRLFQLYLSFYRALSIKSNCVLPLMPVWLSRYIGKHYQAYAKKMLLEDKACLSFSGINVVYENDEPYVCMGLKSDYFNILPPFNGEGDHVLFKVSTDTFYRPFDMAYYKSQSNTTHALIEIFIHPYRIMPVDFAWLHLNAQRINYRDKVLQIKREKPQAFIPLKRFVNMSYRQILKCADTKMFTLFQRVLFSFMFKAYRSELQKHIS